jgi:CheY-like chemotaxis protein
MTKPIHILLVEDLPFIQRAVAHCMNRLNVQLTIASTGQEALLLAKQIPVDLILMDIGLPDMNGDIVTKKIRECEKAQGKHTPIIALTANTNPANVLAYIASGMDEVIAKPITTEIAEAMFKKYIPA